MYTVWHLTLRIAVGRCDRTKQCFPSGIHAVAGRTSAAWSLLAKSFVINPPEQWEGAQLSDRDPHGSLATRQPMSWENTYVLTSPQCTGSKQPLLLRKYVVVFLHDPGEIMVLPLRTEQHVFPPNLRTRSSQHLPPFPDVASFLLYQGKLTALGWPNGILQCHDNSDTKPGSWVQSEAEMEISGSHQNRLIQRALALWMEPRPTGDVQNTTQDSRNWSKKVQGEKKLNFFFFLCYQQLNFSFFLRMKSLKHGSYSSYVFTGEGIISTGIIWCRTLWSIVSWSHLFLIENTVSRYCISPCRSPVKTFL